MITSSSTVLRQSLWMLLAPLLVLAGCGRPTAPEATQVAAHEFTDLPGGGRLVVVPNPAAELVEGVVRFSAGSIHDPAGQFGLAEVLADALRYGGPMQYSGSQLHERLAEQDAWLRVSTTPEFLSFDFACPPAALATTLDALADLVRFPHYPQKVVHRARVRLLERLDAEAVDPAALADQALLDLAYGPDAPFTRAATFASVESIERDDLLAFHHTHIGANRMQIGVAGPLGAVEIVGAIELALGGLGPVAPAPAVEQPKFRVLETPHLLLITVPGADRTELRLGQAGVSIHDPDYAALRIWSDVHGSCASSTSELATDSLEAGLVTQMGAFLRPRWADPGELLGYVTTTHDDPHRGLGRLLMWMNDSALSSGLPTALPDEVIAAARARVVAADERLSRGRDLAGRLLDLDAHGLDLDFWERNQVQVLETGTARIRGAAKQRVTGSAFVVVVASPSGASQAYPLGGTTVFRTASFEPRGTPAGLAAMERMFESLGGRVAWAGLARLDQQGEVRTHGASEPIGVRLWRDFEGHRLRLEHLIGGIESHRVVTPDAAWTRQADVQEDIAPEVLASVRFREARQLPRVLRDLATERSMSVRLNEERLEVLRWGRLLCWIELGEDGRPAVLGYAPTETERQGESEFKVWAEPVEGLILPRVIEEPTLGRSFVWSSARVNGEFADALFRRQ